MNEPQDHWLVRPQTIRRLWWGSGILLALTVLAQVVIDVKGYFGIDGWFGFGALFGLGWWLKRGEDYYGDRHD